MESTPDIPQSAARPRIEQLKPDSETLSDTDGGERATREKLKKTSINALPKYQMVEASTETEREEEKDEVVLSHQANNGENADSPESLNSEDGRGRPTKKRSFEDLQAGDQNHEDLDSPSTQYDHGHMRKKSRDTQTSHEMQEASADEIVSRSGSAEGEHGPEHAQVKTSAVTEDLPANVEDTSIDEGPPVEQSGSEPKKKRSRDQFDNDDDKDVREPEESNGNVASPSADPIGEEDPSLTGLSRRPTGEPDKKRHRDASLEKLLPNEQEGNAAKRLSTSSFKNSSASPLTIGSFANTSTTSPFSSLPQSESIFKRSATPETTEIKEQPQTSSTAFLSSGFAAHSRTEKSPFGALGSTVDSSKSGFGFGGQTSSTAPVGSFGGSTTKSTFGGSTATATFGGSIGGSAFGGLSPFAPSNQSGFGRLGSGGFGGGRGLSSFASSAGPGMLGSTSKAGKPFGAPAQEEKENDSDDEEGSTEAGGESEDRHVDDRFFEHKVETGEEGEETIFSCKAKLLHNDGKEWKERGMGTFKLNVSEESYDNHDEESHKRTARMIMRAEGVFRVILNAPVFKGMKIGSLEGKKPEGKMVFFTVIENGKPAPMILKTGNAKYTEDFYNKIQELEELL